MDAVVLDFSCNPPVPILRSGVPLPTPLPGELLLRVSAASLNPVDGMYGWWSSLLPQASREPGFNFVLGVDVSGVVEAVGPDVDPALGWTKGDRVSAHLNVFRGCGSFGEYCVADAAAAVRIPEGVSHAVAAALPCAGWTAYKALAFKLKAAARKGSSVLVTAGAGAVGGYAVQLARHYGLSPIIATCSAASAESVRALGATHTIDYRSTEDIAAAVKDILPAGVDLAVDSVSAESATGLLNALALDGELATIAGVVARGGEGDSYICGWTVHDVCLGPVAYRSGRPEQLREFGEAMLALHCEGSIDARVKVDRPLRLADVPAILQDYTSASRAGTGAKLVVTVAS